MTAAEFNPMAVAEFPKDHNQPANDNVEPEVFTEINDLFDEAKNFADGEPIADEATAAAITKLYDGLHAAGKRADELRVAEKRPLDEQIDAIQKRFNPFIQPKKGKVDLGKSALSDLLSVWRTRIAAEKAAEAARAAERAAEATRIATAAIQASAGHLTARVDAEELLAHSTSLTKHAARADKAATVGTGLRTVWKAELVDAFAALEWYYDKNPGVFHEFIQKLADADVHSGIRKIEGFRVVEDKVATTGRAK